MVLSPRSGFEKTVNRSGAWFLLAALRERIRKRIRGREGDGDGKGSTAGDDKEGRVGSVGSARSSGSMSPGPPSSRSKLSCFSINDRC